MSLFRICGLFLAAGLLSACGSDTTDNESSPDGGADVADQADASPDVLTDAEGDSGPVAYFIAVHNEPAHVPGSGTGKRSGLPYSNHGGLAQCRG